MRINSLMNNQIQNKRQNLNRNNTSFSGIEKAAQEAVKQTAQKAPKKEGFFVRTLNKLFHLDKHIAEGTAWLSQTKFSKKLVDMTRQFKSAPARWCDVESFAVTFFYMWNTWKSDKVDEERKVPSMIQNAAVTVASSAAAAIIDASFDPLIDKIALKYMELEKTNPDAIKDIGGRSAKEFYGAIKKLKSNTVFTAVVRFIIPVMMVPVVGKIVEKLNEKKKERQEENAENNTLQAQNKQPKPQFVQQNTINVENHHDDDDDDDDKDDKDDDRINNNAGNNNNFNGNARFNNNAASVNENKFKALFA